MTALRRAGVRESDGTLRLGRTRLTYADGAEERVLALLRDCDDLSSTSREMLAKAGDWAERYHTHPDRANVIRAFEIPANATVLEIGAGCGAVTRYLGETAAVVDAVEPMPARARAARERTRDLPNVEVAVGEVADIPDSAEYDLAVVVGVLEYVGDGALDDTERVALLEGIRRRLKPGGSLILAIENKLGVKYFAGAPEDHTSQIFDSIEGYPRGERARTFSRHELAGLFARAGFTTRVHGAFPDYKMTRVVFAPDAGGEDAAGLVTALPVFPSPDWSGERPRLADERRLWEQAVRSGLATEFPNSWVVVATTGSDPHWPSDRVAVGFAAGSTAEFDGVLDARRTPEGTVLHRRWIRPGGQPFQRVDGTTPYRGGATLLELLVAEPTGVARFIEPWRALVKRESANGAPVDLLADNILVGKKDALGVTHVGVRASTWQADDVFERGLLRLGLELTDRVAPGLWRDATTVQDVVLQLGALARLDEDWLERAIARDAEFSAASRLGDPDGGRGVGPELRVRERLARNLWSMPLGHRDPDVIRYLSEEVSRLRARVALLESDADPE